MTSRRFGRKGQARANTKETEDMNAPLIRQMGGLRVKLTRFEEDKNINRLNISGLIASEPNATAGTSQQQSETEKRALRSNSSVNVKPFPTPERRARRKKRHQPPSKLQVMTVKKNELTYSDHFSKDPNETIEKEEDKQSEGRATENNCNSSVFDTPDGMESFNFDTVNTSFMDVSDGNIGEISNTSVEQNNNITVHFKKTDVLNELSELSKKRNERKMAYETQFNGSDDAARPELRSDNYVNDVDMLSNTNAENDVKESATSTLVLNSSSRKGENKRRLPVAPGPYRNTNIILSMGIAFDDEEPGPSTSAFQAPPPKTKNKRKLPPIDNAFETDIPRPFKMPSKIPKITRHGFLEESFYDTPTDEIFVFDAKPNEFNVAIHSFHPKKRQRIIEVDPDEVIIIQPSNKYRPKNRFKKRIHPQNRNHF